MIDENGLRPNVGIILINKNKDVMIGKRFHHKSWQFPQGGIKKNESPRTAMYRELKEEIGLEREHVEILNSTNDWLRYLLPKQYIRKNSEPLCIGQKQIWYLLKLVVDDRYFDLSCTSNPEFDLWKWVDFWQPADEIISFKREVYQQALKQLEPFIV